MLERSGGASCSSRGCSVKLLRLNGGREQAALRNSHRCQLCRLRFQVSSSLFVCLRAPRACSVRPGLFTDRGRSVLLPLLERTQPPFTVYRRVRRAHTHTHGGSRLPLFLQYFWSLFAGRAYVSCLRGKVFLSFLKAALLCVCGRAVEV